MITLQELCAYTDELLKEAANRDYCPNGLQVEGKDPITAIATAVSASLETIEKAQALGVDALFVHHGLFWNKIELRLCDALKAKVKTLLESEISLLSYHLPLDYHKEIGNNWRAAKAMEWDALEEFEDLGVSGKIAPMAPSDFAKKLEKFYHHKAYHAPGSSEKIERVALISGGAHWSLKAAIESGFDAFITGSFDEPMWHMAKESKTHFFALGHSATEEIGVRSLGEHLSETFGLKATFIPSNNPF